MNHLIRQNEEFWPSKSGYKGKNYTLKLNKSELDRIKEEAFLKSLRPNLFINSIIRKTLASGVCSGISCYNLCEFYRFVLPVDDPRPLIAVLQVRTWGRYFLQKALDSYFLPQERILQAIYRGMDSNQSLPVLLVFLPKIFYLTNIASAHTVVPFRWREGLENIYIGIYDSNYPGDDERTLVYNKFTHDWHYDGIDSRKWVITINYLENLTRKVPFLV